MTENLVSEETEGQSKGKNPPLESDFYCQLCAVDCVNSTGKLLHSLDANHIEAYLLSLKMTPKRKPTFQDKSVIKFKWNQVNTPKVEFEPGGQHLVCDAQVGEEDRKHAITKQKNEEDLLNNMLLNDLKFSILHSQSSTPRYISGLTASETESGSGNTHFLLMKENHFSGNYSRHTDDFHSKNGKDLEENILSDQLNNTSCCSTKGSQVIEPFKAVFPDSKLSEDVCDVDFIGGKLQSIHASQKMQNDIIHEAVSINEDVESKCMKKPPDKDYCRRIIVEGISPGTNKTIIIRQFSKYGFINSCNFTGSTVHIEYLEWQSVERILAEQTLEKITIHGKEVQIKKNRKKPNKGLQNFKLPKNVKDLFSSEEKFLNGLDKFIASFQLDLADIDNQQAVCKSVTSSLKNFAPRVYPYGSRITGLAFKNSDLDIFVNITKPYQYFKNKYQRHIQELIIHDAAQDIMCSSDFSNVVEVPKASVPLISCKHVPTGLKCDLTFCYPYQVYNTGLTIMYLSVDNRVRPLILLIRYWASAHGLLGKGKFSSYSLNLMCIFYLQQIPEKPILPSVSLLMKLARDHERVSYGYWDCGYCEDISLIPKSVNDTSLFHLVKGFFKFYAEFDTNNVVVCPFIGKSAQKTIFNPGMEQILPIEFEKYKSNCLEGLTEPLNVDHVLCIQDPFVHNSNVAKQNRKHIVERFKICCGFYTQEQD